MQEGSGGGGAGRGLGAVVRGMDPLDLWVASSPGEALAAARKRSAMSVTALLFQGAPRPHFSRAPLGLKVAAKAQPQLGN